MTWIHYLILGYIIIGMFWGDYATTKQQIAYPTHSSGPWLFLTFLTNSLFWPVGMLFAFFREE